MFDACNCHQKVSNTFFTSLTENCKRIVSLFHASRRAQSFPFNNFIFVVLPTVKSQNQWEMAKNLENKSRKSGRWTCWRRCWTTRPCSRRRTTRTRPPCSKTVLSVSPLASSWSGESCSWGKPFNPGFELAAIRTINFDFWGQGQTWGLISAILKKTATGQGLACTMITRFSGFPHTQYGLMHRKMLLERHIVITSAGDTLFQTGQGMRKNWSSQSFG